MLVRKLKISLRVLIAMTISSKLALPARSPKPLIVHSTCLAPPITAAKELATAMPKSLWQCVDHTTLSLFGTRAINSRIRSPQGAGIE